MSTTNGTMKSFKVTDKDGNVYVMTLVDTEARQAIDEGKYMDFDPDYFTSQLSQDQKKVNIGLNGVPLGVDSDSPLKFKQDNAQGIVFGSDAPFATAIAPEYDATSTYAVNDHCMHLGKYYECGTAISTAEAWNAAHWTETDIETVILSSSKIAVFDGEESMSDGTTWPDEAKVRAAISSGKYVVIRMIGVGGYDYYTIRWVYGYQYFFNKVGTTGIEIRLERNTAGTAYEWSYYSEPVSPSAKIFTGTYNPAASPADYSQMPNTLSIEAAINAGNDVVMMLTNPVDSNVYAYRLVSNAQYTKRFMAIDNAAMSAGWESVPGLMMTYAGPGNPWGWSMARYLTQELKTGSIAESDIISYGGHCGVDNSNALTTMTLTSVNSVTMHTNNYNVTANNFAVQIDNTGNSNDVTIDVRHGSDSLKYSVAGGNVVGAGKYMQLTCVGSCWTLAEFTVPTP